jgi:alpha-tubulin suppressor-like RCC1 family protein
VDAGGSDGYSTLDGADDHVSADVTDEGMCTGTQLFCDSGCVSPNDIHSCGSCSNDCTQLPSVSDAGLACNVGHCSYQCAVGFADCSDGGLGCITPLEIDARNCGACGKLCLAACGHSACLQVKTIVAGGNTACAVLSDGTVRCWGDNASGELGMGSNVPSIVNKPSPVQNLSSVITVTVGQDHACALVAGGTVECWGGNSNGGELGNGTTTATTNDFTPGAAVAIGVATAISAGGFHTCALLSGGGIDCWGANSAGELGNGSKANAQPVPVGALVSGATAVASGYRHTCALMSGGTVSCWGYNGDGELGNGTQGNPVATPVPVSTLTGITAIAAGSFHTCALLGTGTVACWGMNTNGQLGNGTTGGFQSTPVAVSNFTNVTAIFAGGDHTCVILAGTDVACWGGNSFGQIGDGTTISRSTPFAQPQPNKYGLGATAIAAGDSSTCALIRAGRVECWGDNSHGQIGNGTSVTPQTTPALLLW